MVSSNDTKVVILAGGKGVRFRPFSFVIPKPLMPIGEEPILLHLINRLKKSKIHSFLISTGYQAELVRAYFGEGSRFGVKIKYFHEEKPLGTAGPLSLMKNEFKDHEYFILINGDNYTELKFDRMIQFAEEHQYDLVVGYVERTEKRNFGIVEIADHQVTQLIEKPETKLKINAGIYVLKGRTVQTLPEAQFLTMPDLIQSHLEQGKKVGAFKIEDFWISIENAENLDEALKQIKGQP